MSWKNVGKEIEAGKQVYQYKYSLLVTFGTWLLKIIFFWILIAGILVPLSDWVFALMRPVGGPIVVIPLLLYIWLKFKK